MGRQAVITDANLRAATAQVAARQGVTGATVSAIAKEAGVPTGSVYHRVPSRAALLAQVWIEAADRFGTAFLGQLAQARDLDEAAATALATPRFAREHPAEGVILFVQRRDDFLDRAPADLRARAGQLTAALRDGVAAAARRLAPNDRRARERFALALIGVPHGAVRIYLPQATPPADIDPIILAAARAALAAAR
jgi:AcrR family transcriptional regulator